MLSLLSKASSGSGVKKPADEESSGHRFVAWVLRHADWPCGRDRQRVAKTGGYCWPTPKCRNVCVQHACFEAKKAQETSPRKSTPRTLKQVGQQYPGVIFIYLLIVATVKSPVFVTVGLTAI